MATISFVRCPARYSCCAGKCGGETVEARFGARTVELAPCSVLRDQGWTGDVNVVLWHSQAVELEPAGRPALQHVEGLVTFA